MIFFDNDIDIAVDLIAVDYDRYNELKNEIGYIYKTIDREDVLIAVKDSEDEDAEGEPC